MKQDEYRIDLDIFEGPLDLLLYLIKRDEVDIYNIPIEKITTQYMEYLGLMRMLDLNIAGEFIVMAATLMLIKSRMLLPVEERPEQEAEEEGEDPRWELVRQLVEYKKFKDAAARLQGREFDQENIFGTGGYTLKLDSDEDGMRLRDVSLFDLITAFNDVLKRAGAEQIRLIEADRFTVAEKVEYILDILRRREEVSFGELFDGMPSRGELICTFLALLELTRLRQVALRQKTRFGEISIRAAEEAAAAAAGPDAGGAGAGG